MVKSKIISSVRWIINQNIGIQSESQTLAFFGFTSKSESHYRDIIAFNLHKQFKNEFYVTREWNKCDIAILDKNNGRPVFLLELKVCYNVDLYKRSTLKEYVYSINKDFAKSKAISDSRTELYSILFIFKPEQTIPVELQKIVKYSKSINSGLKKYDPGHLDRIGQQNLRHEFDNIEFFHIRRDNVFDLTCGLAYCIIGE